MRFLLSQIDQVSAGEVVYPPGGRLGPRWQRDVELVLVHDGHARIAVDGEARANLRAGSVGLLLPGHRAVRVRRRRRDTPLVGPGAGRRSAGRAALGAAGRASGLDGADRGRARGRHRRATPLSTAEPLLAALAAAAFWRYAGEAESHVGGPGETVERARRFLQEHLADPGVDLEQVARAAPVTPPHLVRRFRAELGVTPMAYLWQRRVATGIDLLTNTGLPVGDIAARTGFKSVYHFSRRVKEQAGAPPTQVRRNVWI
jgi:AraC family transcriptional regulator of arabinose operon